jgi:hypothetical protein
VSIVEEIDGCYPVLFEDLFMKLAVCGQVRDESIYTAFMQEESQFHPAEINEIHMSPSRLCCLGAGVRLIPVHGNGNLCSSFTIAATATLSRHAENSALREYVKR